MVFCSKAFPQRFVGSGAKMEESGDEQGVAMPLAIFSILRMRSVSLKNKGVIFFLDSIKSDKLI
jgi:hypothetical protein